MQPTTQPVTQINLPNGSDARRPARTESISYQVVTIGAILLVLVSSWVF